jgi:AcrR family transcriptional regulator
MRLKPDKRGEQILDAGLSIACADGLRAVSATAIAKRLGVARSLVCYYFDADTLRNLVVMRAAAVRCVRVLAQAITSDDTLAPRIGDIAYNQTLAYLMTGKQCPAGCNHAGCKQPREDK